MTIPPFKPSSRCPKCGCKDVKVFYRPIIAEDLAWSQRQSEGRWPEGEYLHRTCQQCQYDWPEACIKPRGKKQKPAP